MELFILLIPWVLAIGWMFWTKHLMIAALLCIGAFFHIPLAKKGPVPFIWLVMSALLQLGWIAAAFFTDTPFLMLGMIAQLIALLGMMQTLREEKQKRMAMAANFEQQKVLLYELRRQRHDLQKHVAALLHHDGESGAISAYKADVHSRYIELDQIIRGESNAIAGILYSYLEQAKEQEVVLDYHIQHPVSGLPLSEFEWVSFFGNMLENAIEAAAEFGKSKEKPGKVRLICRRQSGIWIIHCQNDTMPLPENIIEQMFTNKATSTKGGHHEGIGTQEINKIVNKYRGALDFSVIQNQFTLKIKIPNIRKNKRNASKSSMD